MKNYICPAGVAAIQTLTQTTDDNLVIICYSAKRYAQSTTTVLSTLAYDITFILHPQFMSVSQR